MMQSDEFAFFRQFLIERTAVVFEADQNYLIESRLTPIMYEFGFESLSELADQLRAVPYGPLHQRAIEALTNHETSFFRDLHPFDSLTRTVIPALVKKRADLCTMTIWSAACSSGQEPYSIAMALREQFPELAHWTINIIASDVSTNVLKRAETGVYSQHEVNRGLPIHLLLKYFNKVGHDWQLSDDIRHSVTFRAINLASHWPFLPDLDIIFLRNVMIYFDVETKKAILRQVRRLLKPDGYLFLGGAETTLNLDKAFKRIESNAASYYQLSHDEEMRPCPLQKTTSVK